MPLLGKLAKRDGKLYVAFAQTLDTEPTRRTMWWRVVETRGYWSESPQAGDLAERSRAGAWETRNPTTGRSTGTVSTGDGSTQAEFVDESPVLPPSAGGKELRWHHGEWQKLLRTGWVPAGEGKAKTKGKAKLDQDIAHALAKRGG